MSATSTRPLGLYFDPDGYVEHTTTSRPAQSQAMGLMGRQVAGKEFLEALLKFGTFPALEAVCRVAEVGQAFQDVAKQSAAQTGKTWDVRISLEANFCRQPAADLLYFPCPPITRMAWGRQSVGGGRFALCGVTHTTCTPGVTTALCELLTAPYEPFDALICTSQAVLSTVKAITEYHAEYLKERFGGQPKLRPRLEVIPLGVNPDKFRPATPPERQSARGMLGIAADEVMVLCVGRLSHHAKAHPYPVWAAVEQAARRTKKKLHLVFAGWAANANIDAAFKEGARTLVPSARVSFLDGQVPAIRANVWPAADIFMSLPDNIQETFGLVIAEAMACGLPVIGSEWDGYRDMIVHGVTGFTVPTMMIPGATTVAPNRLISGSVNYDQFLAHTSQVTIVDAQAAADALCQLVEDESLRQRFGTMGRQRVLEQFTWERVVQAYENLWREQRQELAKYQRPAHLPYPARMPPPEVAFASYPTRWLADEVVIQTTPDATRVLKQMIEMPITNVQFVPRHRDEETLTKVLEHARQPRALRELVAVLNPHDPASEVARCTIAWLLKYDLLRLA